MVPEGLLIYELEIIIKKMSASQSAKKSDLFSNLNDEATVSLSESADVPMFTLVELSEKILLAQESSPIFDRVFTSDDLKNQTHEPSQFLNDLNESAQMRSREKRKAVRYDLLIPKI